MFLLEWKQSSENPYQTDPMKDGSKSLWICKIHHEIAHNPCHPYCIYFVFDIIYNKHVCDAILFISSSANADPKFEGRGGEELANEISTMLLRAYSHIGCLDLASLSVIPHKQCWLLYLDVLVSHSKNELQSNCHLQVFFHTIFIYIYIYTP